MSDVETKRGQPDVDATRPDPKPVRARPDPVRRAGLFLSGVVAALIVVALPGLVNPPPAPITGRDIEVAVASMLASQTAPPPDSELVYDAVRPSLVLIQTTGAAPSGASPAGGLGSGVVVTEDGAVLTALHVVSDARSIRLTFADGSTSSATIATEQPENDIAVLEADDPPGGLIPATLGNPGAMRIGSEAYVVGNPFGLYGSLSAGVVSGLDRSFEVKDTKQVIEGLIQVDAAINRGNSGGPLLDRLGRVVGIVTALANPTEDGVFIGIGFAVPIDVAGGAAGLPAY